MTTRTTRTASRPHRAPTTKRSPKPKPRARWGKPKPKAKALEGTPYRSKFELDIARDLEKRGVPFDYEKLRLTYTVEHTYKPDFGVGRVIIEAKGYFTSADRSKLLAVKRANPEIDLRLLFMRASNKLNKESETTYGDWADKHGFTWAEGTGVPGDWVRSAVRKRRRLANPKRSIGSRLRGSGRSRVVLVHL